MLALLYGNHANFYLHDYENLGWKDTILSLPKKWLSTQKDSTEEVPGAEQPIVLPKLPVPPLQQTLSTYLDYATVLAGNNQKLDYTKQVVKAFADNEMFGPSAQAKLEELAEKTENWVAQWWLEDMYLKVRNPLPINSNPGMVFPPRKFNKVDEVAELAAIFVDELMDYKEMLDSGQLPLERATSREKGQPLCMEQYYRLLGVCRIPGVDLDRLELPINQLNPDEHIIVACRNHFYVIPVKAQDRGRLNYEEVKSQVLQVLADASGAPAAPPIGLLTAMERNDWANARELLIKGGDNTGDKNNIRNLELISKALCLICLDGVGGDRLDCDADTNAMLRAMHGGGSKHHTANRWFDKTVQLIISSDGTLGMCYEHSAAEGVAVIRLAEQLLMREPPPAPLPPPTLLPSPEKLIWNLHPDLNKYLEKAKKDIDKLIGDLDCNVYTYKGYGRDFMKSCKTSPDAYIQLALQYTYYKMYGCLTSTYESASLRRFAGGRVDNIRSAHSPALRWVQAMCAAAEDGAHSKNTAVTFNLFAQPHILERFEAAARKQTEVMVANITGQGIDNHLLALREISKVPKLHDMFTDEMYAKMMEFRLSTSQVATTLDGTFMGYGAVVPHGYGVSYNPKKDKVIFCISCFASSDQTSTEAFRDTLKEALSEMKLMFTENDQQNDLK